MLIQQNDNADDPFMKTSKFQSGKGINNSIIYEKTETPLAIQNSNARRQKSFIYKLNKLRGTAKDCGYLPTLPNFSHIDTE